MKKRIFLCAFCILITVFAVRAQSPQQLTLADCYKQAEQNYPLIKQRELIAKTSEYNVDNIQKSYLPQLSFTGQATYQSTVTQIPIKVPGVNIPALSKDQYKAYGEINQVLYTGGELEQQKQLVEKLKYDPNFQLVVERGEFIVFKRVKMTGSILQTSP